MTARYLVVMGVLTAAVPARAGLKECLNWLRILASPRAPVTLRLPADTTLPSGFDVKGKLTRPLEFSVSFRAALGKNPNILDWPPFHQELLRLRDLTRRVLDSSEEKEALTSLLARLDAALSGGHLAYRDYLNLFAEAPGPISRAIMVQSGRGFRLGRSAVDGDPLVAEQGRNAIDQLLSRGAVVVPIVRDEPLSQAELTLAAAAGIVYVQLPGRFLQADGFELTPLQFFEHDLFHARSLVPTLLKRVTRNFNGPPEDDILSGILVMSALVEKAGRIRNRGLRDGVSEVLFNYVHERPDFGGSLRTFTSALRPDPNSHQQPVRTLFLSRREGEDDASYDARYGEMFRWLEREVSRLIGRVP